MKKYINIDIKDLPLRKKLFKSFIIIAIIGSLASIISLAFLEIITFKYNEAVNNYGFSQGEVGKLGIKIENSYSIVRDIVIAENESFDDTRKMSVKILLMNIQKNSNSY